MMKKKTILAELLLIAVVLFLTACGGTEPTITEYGIGGYVYVPQTVLVKNLQVGIQSFQTMGDDLYFSQSTSGVCTVRKLPLNIVEQATEKWNFKDEGTLLLALSTVAIRLPEGALESGQEPDYISLLDTAMEPDRVASSPSMSQNLLVYPDMDYCRFYLQDYMADTDGNITFSVSVMTGSFFNLDTVGYILCRQNADGSSAYRLFFSEYPDFTIDGNGRTYLLDESGILILDRNGKRIGDIVPGNYQYASSAYQKSLYSDGGDYVYYFSRGTAAFCQLTEKEGKFRLEDLKGIPISGNRYYAIPGGNLLYSESSDGSLYQWNRQSASAEPLLKWQDSDMISSYIQAIAPISSDKLIVINNGRYSGMYLLTKTSVDELPQKEEIVLASLYPDSTLWEEVMDFNRMSNEYRIIIEQYGASGYYAGDDPEANARLDATLISANPPDLLDLSSLDILKYTNQRALEDLTPYLSDSGLEKEDFLENVLESFTIEEQLVCIPIGLRLSGFYGRASLLDTLPSWTMEDVYMLTESHPGAELIYGASRDYMLQTFCAPYCLEKFIDWDTGKCSFDSQEFHNLILWLQENFQDEYGNRWLPQDIHISDDILLVRDDYIYNFLAPLSLEAQFGEDIRLIGFPTADGAGKIGCTPMNALGIASNSRHKEGAWKFLEYHLTKDEADFYSVTYGSYFPTLKSQLTDRLELATEELYVHIGEDGNPVVEDGKVNRFTYTIEGETINYLSVPTRLTDELLSALENLDLTPRPEAERQIIAIMTEEIAGYFNGDKTLEEVTDIIQSRVQILVQENTLVH